MRITELDLRHDQEKFKKAEPTPDQYRPLRHLTDGDVMVVGNKLKVLCQSVIPPSVFLTLVETAPLSTQSSKHIPSMWEMVAEFKATDGTQSIVDYLRINTLEEHCSYLK